MSVAPAPSVWAMSGYDVPVEVNRVSKEFEREYRSMLDAAVGHIPADLPVTKSSSKAPRAERSPVRPTRATTTSS